MLNLFKPKWRSMDSAPRDGSYVVLLHRTHGIIQAWFCQGEWEEHPEYGREYTGSSWVLGDDIKQVEVEEIPHEHGGGYEDGPILGWMPVDALEVIPNYGECPHECVKNGCIELYPNKMIFKLRNIAKTLKCKKCDRNRELF